MATDIHAPRDCDTATPAISQAISSKSNTKNGLATLLRNCSVEVYASCDELLFWWQYQSKPIAQARDMPIKSAPWFRLRNVPNGMLPPGFSMPQKMEFGNRFACTFAQNT